LDTCARIWIGFNAKTKEKSEVGNMLRVTADIISAVKEERLNKWLANREMCELSNSEKD